jgi:hypothetical protein
MTGLLIDGESLLYSRVRIHNLVNRGYTRDWSVTYHDNMYETETGHIRIADRSISTRRLSQV